MINFEKWLKLITRAFILLSPFYYAIVFVEGHNLGEESFFIRAVKDLIILFLFILWGLNLILYPNKNRYIKNIDIIIFLFILVGIIKLLLYDSNFSLTFVRFYVEYVFFYFIARKLYDSPKEIIEEIERIIIVSAIVSIIGLIEFFLGGIETIYSKAAGQIRIISTLFNPNALGWYLVMTSSLLIAFILSKTELVRLSSKFSQVICLLLNIFAIILTGSRSSLLILAFIFFIAIVAMGKIRLVLQILFLSILIIMVFFSVVDINFGELRIFNSGLESERSLIFTLVYNFVQNLSLDQLIFGVSNYNFYILRELALVFDSQMILDFIVGGLFTVFLKYFIIFYFIYKLSKIKYDDIRKPIFLFFISIIFISTLGNVLMIFPHGLYFWYFIGVISVVDKFKINSRSLK